MRRRPHAGDVLQAYGKKANLGVHAAGFIYACGMVALDPGVSASHCLENVGGDYITVLEWLVQRRPLGWGLERVRKVLKALGNPQDGLPTVHVAGTNGKGSVCAKVAHGLQKLLPGGRVGLTMSPHLVTARERIWVGAAMIEPDDFVHAVGCVLRAALVESEAQNLSFFEIVTMAAFHHFFYGPPGTVVRPFCSVAVVETGLGGRLDATNALAAPACAVIASVDIDHCRLLGATPELIAEEKAQIAKPGCPFLLGPHAKGDAAAVAERIARERGVSSFKRVLQASGDEDFDAENSRVAAAALEIVCERLDIQTPAAGSAGAVRALVACGTPPCRFQVFTEDDNCFPTPVLGPVNPALLARIKGLVLDVAHNEDAFARLAQRLDRLRGGGGERAAGPGAGAPLVVAAALSKDRTYNALAPLLALKKCTVFLVDGRHALLQRRDRQARPGEKPLPIPLGRAKLAASGSGNLYFLQGAVAPLSLPEQLHELLHLAQTQNAWVVVCGSFFVMRETLTFFGSHFSAGEAETRLFELGAPKTVPLDPKCRADVTEDLNRIFDWGVDRRDDATCGRPKDD